MYSEGKNTVEESQDEGLRMVLPILCGLKGVWEFLRWALCSAVGMKRFSFEGNKL